MKKLKLIFIFSLTTLLLTSSCEDAYNIEQPGELNEADLKTLEDLQGYLNAAVYSSLGLTSEIGFTGIFTDETGEGRSNGGSDRETHRWLLNSDNGYSNGIWYGKYQTINRVNRTLRIAARIGVPTDPAQLAQYNSILAEARAIRAFCYLDLLTYFSTDMKNDSALGVMYFGDTVPGSDDDYPRSTNGVVFAGIEADLNYAYANVSTANDYKRITKLAIDAMRARMYLYRGNHTLAKQYAETVIAGGLTLTLATPVPTPAPTNPNFSVFAASNPLSAGAATAAWNTAFYNYVPSATAAITPYRRMFADLPAGNSRYEIIFALDRPTAGAWGNIAAAFTQNTTTANGSPRWEVSRSLFNELRAVPGDVRRYTTVDPSSLINQNYDQPNVDYIGTDVLAIDKYPGRTGVPLRNDIKVFRLSEMYLILAECYANSGALNGASNSVASVIKQIRDARNFLGPQPLPNYANATAAYADIVLERRKELSFEGHRYIDAKRLGGLSGTTISRHITDDSNQTIPLTLAHDDYRMTMPIPRAELNANGSVEQNPDY